MLRKQPFAARKHGFTCNRELPNQNLSVKTEKNKDKTVGRGSA
jgi:hypothetical protein